MFKTVNVTPETYELLKARGKKGDTFDDIIRQLLKKEADN